MPYGTSPYGAAPFGTGSAPSAPPVPPTPPVIIRRKAKAGGKPVQVNVVVKPKDKPDPNETPNVLAELYDELFDALEQEGFITLEEKIALAML